jgi:serine/threonine protein kinase
MFCSHPNVLGMFGFFADENKIYLLLELACGGCLFREVRQRAYFAEDHACYYLRQVVAGMRYLHGHSVIHRDIKPENILNCFSVLKLCDFGWATYAPL